MDEPRPDQFDGHSQAASQINWAEVLAQHQRWLRAVIYARVGEPQAVDEVFQELALNAVRQKAPIQDPTKVAPWLYRLAVLTSLMYRRKQGRQKKWLKRYGAESGNGKLVTPSPLDWLLKAERVELVREAMASLPARDAEILLLKYGQDWSYQEIADHLGLTNSAVQTRLHRARQKLRDRLSHLASGGRDHRASHQAQGEYSQTG